MVIDAPDVKGNPKGVMRMHTPGQKPDDRSLWFYTATHDKKTYALVVIGHNTPDHSPPLHTPGEFAAWETSGRRAYYVAQYVLDGDDLTLDIGNHDAFRKVAAGEKFPAVGNSVLGIYQTPEKWLAEYLTKHGAASVFDGTNGGTYRRAK